MSEGGNSFASRLLPIINNSRKLDQYVSTCQIGITIASLVLGAYGQAKIALYLAPFFQTWGGLQEMAAHSTSVAIVLISLSVLQMFFGEFIPKTLALRYANKLAVYTVIPLLWSQIVFSWFIKLLNGSSIIVLKLLGVPLDRHKHIHSPEEIELLIDQSRDGGLLQPDEHQRLHQALKMSTRSARHLIIPRPHMSAINIDIPLEEVLEKVVKSPYTRLPAYRGTIDNITGLLHVKNIVAKKLEKGDINIIEELLTPVLFIPENMKASRVMKILQEEHSEMAIVVDEYGGVAGLITLEDIMAEVLGDISDEFKDKQLKLEKLSDRTFRLDGTVRIDEAERRTGIAWKGQASTVGGQIIETIGRIPKEGENININGIEVKIEKMAKNRVSSVIITMKEVE